MYAQNYHFYARLAFLEFTSDFKCICLEFLPFTNGLLISIVKNKVLPETRGPMGRHWSPFL